MAYFEYMPKRSSTKDENQIAHQLTQEIILETESKPDIIDRPNKNQAAVMLGRLGGLKGGKARSLALSSERKSEIARKAAETRWKKKASKEKD